MRFAEDEQQSDQNPLALHQQHLRRAMEDSAALLAQSLRNQQKLDGRFERGLAVFSQASSAGEADPMGSITADFVSKAYQRAQQTFEELEQKMNETKANWLSPLNRTALPGGQTDAAIEDAYAATDRIMSIATSHLSEALKAMVEAMDHRSDLKRNHEHTL